MITLELTPDELKFLSWCVTWYQISPLRLADADKVLLTQELAKRLKEMAHSLLTKSLSSPMTGKLAGY